MRRSEHYGELQRLVDGLFDGRETVSTIDLMLHARILDLHPDLMEICSIVPPGQYIRESLCDQMNSAITAHGWGSKYGTVW